MLRTVIPSEDLLEVETDHKPYVPGPLRQGLELTEEQRTAWRKEASDLCYPVPNGYNDPLSNLLALDTIIRLKPGKLIRAAALRQVLSVHRAQIAWDNVTVGRILAGIAGEALADGHKLFRQGRDRRGTFFVLETSIPAYQWIHQLRAYISAVVAEDFEYRTRGLQPPSRLLSVWEGRQEDTRDLRVAYA